MVSSSRCFDELTNSREDSSGEVDAVGKPMKNTMSNAAPSPPRAQSSDSTQRFESAQSLLSSESSESSQSSLGAAAAADAPVAEAAAATVDNHSPGGTAPIPEAPQVLTPPGTNRTDHLRADEESAYCPYFQHVVELLGRRWTSSIVMGPGMRAGC